MSSTNRSKGLAARMGRWSAHHRKIAIFGWLGLVVVAVLIGKAAGTVELKQNDAIPGESGRATQTHRRAVRAESQRNSARSKQDADRRRCCVPCRRRRRRRRHQVVHGRRRHRLALRAQQRRSDLAGPPFGTRQLRVQELGGRRDEHLETGRGRRCSRAEGTPRTDDRRVRRRQLGTRGRRSVLQGSRQGGAPVAAGHPHHPADRVRCARRRRHPAAARAHVGDRDDVPDRATEPSHAGRRAGQRGDPAHRSRRRRRLLALLSQTRTRGTGSRSQRVGGARGRGGDVGTLDPRSRASQS